MFFDIQMREIKKNTKTNYFVVTKFSVLFNYDNFSLLLLFRPKMKMKMLFKNSNIINS